MFRKEMMSAYTILRSDGPGQVARISFEKATMWWRQGRRFEIGKFVGRPTAIARLDGCRFALDSPVITDELRYLLLSGKHEKAERELTRRFVRRDVPIVEFGGALGVVSCIINKRLHDRSRHVVIEANPALIPVLIANRDQNQCKFAVWHRAVAYDGPLARLHLETNLLASSVRATTADTVSVPTTTLRQILEDRGFSRCSLICDIEGGESDLVRHESETLGRSVDTLILELHERLLGRDKTAELLDELRRVGFEIVGRSWETLALKNGRFSSRVVRL